MRFLAVSHFKGRSYALVVKFGCHTQGDAGGGGPSTSFSGEQDFFSPPAFLRKKNQKEKSHLIVRLVNVRLAHTPRLFCALCHVALRPCGCFFPTVLASPPFMRILNPSPLLASRRVSRDRRRAAHFDDFFPSVHSTRLLIIK